MRNLTLASYLGYLLANTPYTSNGFPLFHIIDKRCKINFYSYLLLFSAYLFSLTYYHLNAPGSVSLNYYTVHISLCTLLLKPSTTSNQGKVRQTVSKWMIYFPLTLKSDDCRAKSTRQRPLKTQYRDSCAGIG